MKRFIHLLVAPGPSLFWLSGLLLLCLAAPPWSESTASENVFFGILAIVWGLGGGVLEKLIFNWSKE